MKIPRGHRHCKAFILPTMLDAIALFAREGCPSPQAKPGDLPESFSTTLRLKEHGGWFSRRNLLIGFLVFKLQTRAFRSLRLGLFAFGAYGKSTKTNSENLAKRPCGNFAGFGNGRLFSAQGRIRNRYFSADYGQSWPGNQG